MSAVLVFYYTTGFGLLPLTYHANVARKRMEGKQRMLILLASGTSTGSRCQWMYRTVSGNRMFTVVNGRPQAQLLHQPEAWMVGARLSLRLNIHHGQVSRWERPVHELAVRCELSAEGPEIWHDD